MYTLQIEREREIERERRVALVPLLGGGSPLCEFVRSATLGNALDVRTVSAHILHVSDRCIPAYTDCMLLHTYLWVPVLS